MNLIISFFLSLFIYIFIVFSFFYFLFYKKESERVREVFIHQAIVAKHKTKHRRVQNRIKKSIAKRTISKKSSPKKSPDTISKGGDDIKFDDLFSNVSDNIPTEKLKIKKQEELTKEKGNTKREEISKLVKKELSQLQSSIAIVSNSDETSKEFISDEFGKIWDEMNTKDGDFVTLQVDISNGSLNFSVIATNLDKILLDEFLSKLRKVDTSKINEFHGRITFNTKLKESK